VPTKKLTALSIPTLAPGEWYDAVLPGLILRVGKKRRTWQFRYHAGGSYHRKPLGHFPAMELADAREAGRKLIGRAEKGPSCRHSRRPRRSVQSTRAVHQPFDEILKESSGGEAIPTVDLIEGNL
jgi:hypothetical protein